MTAVGVLDRGGLLRVFAELSGRRLLGVVEFHEGLELVFEGSGGNLVTVFTEGRRCGTVAFGGVTDPEGYAERQRWREVA